MSGDKKNRELTRAAESVGAVITEYYLVKRWQAGIIFGAAALMVAGLIMQSYPGRAMAIASYALVIAGAIVVFGTYAAMRIRGPLGYTACWCKAGERSAELVQLGRKTCYLTVGDFTIKYEKGKVTEAEPYRPELRWNWFLGAELDAVKRTAGDVRYDGRYEGKKAVMGLKNGMVDYAEVTGVRMRYKGINNIVGKAVVPAALYDEALRRGATKAELSFITPDVSRK